MSSLDELAAAKQELALLQKQLEIEKQEHELKAGLPFLYKYKHYHWSREYYESTKKWNFLCAANQIGKSTVNIRRCLNLATNKELWPKLWPGRTPNLFWYFYPSNKQVTTELQTKWELYLPSGKYKESGPYAWEYIKDSGDIVGIQFASGIRLEFKYYSQKEEHLQSSSVYAVFLDEECPVGILNEIQLRISNTDGYFHMVFTATLGQDYWRRTIEPRPDEEELYAEDSLKLQISMYDCLQFEDGSPGQWNEKKIKIVENSCNSEQQKLIRVHGRFIKEEGSLYGSFIQDKNVVGKVEIPDTWRYYVSVDVGSGKAKFNGTGQSMSAKSRAHNKSGHPAAIVIMAVNPEYNKGIVVDAWRGDFVETNSTDILLQMQKMEARTIKGVDKINMRIYDYASAEFLSVATRAGIAFTAADKKIASGVATVNNLFSLTMLYLSRGAEDCPKLITELLTVTEKDSGYTPVMDDLSDALRYCCRAVPWAWDLDKLQAILGVDITVEAAKESIRRPEIDYREQKRQERLNYRSQYRRTGVVEDSEWEEFNELCGT